MSKLSFSLPLLKILSFCHQSYFTSHLLRFLKYQSAEHICGCYLLLQHNLLLMKMMIVYFGKNLEVFIVYLLWENSKHLLNCLQHVTTLQHFWISKFNDSTKMGWQPHITLIIDYLGLYKPSSGTLRHVLSFVFKFLRNFIVSFSKLLSSRPCF